MRVLVVITLCSLCFSGSAQKRTYKVRQQQKDLAILREALLDVTGDPYLYSNATQLAAIFDSVEYALNTPRTARELFQAYSFLAASIGCGHTIVSPNGPLIRDYLVYSKSLPVSITVRDQKLYAERNFGSKPRMEEGNEITAINGQNSADVLMEMRRFFSSDGDNHTFKDQFFAEFFNFYHFVTFGEQDSFRIAFINDNNEPDTLVAEADDADYKAFKRQYKNSLFINYGKSEDSFGKLKPDRINNAVIWTLPSFAHASGNKYEAYVDSRMRAINNSEMDYLIIDLRGNLGGVVQKYLMGYFIPGRDFIAEMHVRHVAKPIHHRRYKKWSTSWLKYRAYAMLEKAEVENEYGTLGTFYWIKERYVTERCQKKLIVLVDGMTFSAGSNAAANLKAKAGAIIIGEETGGSYKGGNTGQLLMKLPKSKIQVVVNPVHYSNNVNLDMGRSGLVPDIIVERGYERRREDRIMDAAFEYIRKQAVVDLEMKENGE